MADDNLLAAVAGFTGGFGGALTRQFEREAERRQRLKFLKEQKEQELSFLQMQAPIREQAEISAEQRKLTGQKELLGEEFRLRTEFEKMSEEERRKTRIRLQRLINNSRERLEKLKTVRNPLVGLLAEKRRIVAIRNREAEFLGEKGDETTELLSQINEEIERIKSEEGEEITAPFSGLRRQPSLSLKETTLDQLFEGLSNK